MNKQDLEDRLNQKFKFILANMENMRDKEIFPEFKIIEHKIRNGEIRYNVYMTNKEIPYIGSIFFALMQERELEESLYVIDKILELLKNEFMRYN